MPYCTAAQVTAQWPTAGAHLAANLVAWIVISDAIIDTSLRSAGYVTPVAGTAPAAISKWSINLTGIQMFENLYENQNAVLDEDLLRDLKTQVATLKDLVEKGIIKFRIPRIRFDPIADGDSLTVPEVSQFAVPSGFPLLTEDIND